MKKSGHLNHIPNFYEIWGFWEKLKQFLRGFRTSSKPGLSIFGSRGLSMNEKLSVHWYVAVSKLVRVVEFTEKVKPGHFWP